MEQIALDLGSLFGTAVGGAGGGGIVVMLAKTYLSRTMKELDQMVTAMKYVQEQLVALTIRLERIEQIEDLIRKHDRQIASLESRISIHVDNL